VRKRAAYSFIIRSALGIAAFASGRPQTFYSVPLVTYRATPVTVASGAKSCFSLGQTIHFWARPQTLSSLLERLCGLAEGKAAFRTAAHKKNWEKQLFAPLRFKKNSLATQPKVNLTTTSLQLTTTSLARSLKRAYLRLQPSNLTTPLLQNYLK